VGPRQICAAVFGLMAVCCFLVVIGQLVWGTASLTSLVVYPLLAVLFLLLSVSNVLVHALTHPPWQGKRPPYCPVKFGDPKGDWGLDFEVVEIRAVDGAALEGWLVHPQGPRSGVGIVCCHGGGRDKRAFCRHSPFLSKAGHTVLLFDCRAATLGAMTTHGVEEHRDLLSAAKWLQEQQTDPVDIIVAMGTSIGGSSAIIAAAKDPELIQGVIAENPFTSWQDNMDNIVKNLIFKQMICKSNTTAATILYPAAAACSFLVQAITKQCMPLIEKSTPSALDAVCLVAPRPLLLMHGTEDEIVPFSHSQRLFRTAMSELQPDGGSCVNLWAVEGGKHVQLFDLMADEYQRRVLGLIQEVRSAEG